MEPGDSEWRQAKGAVRRSDVATPPASGSVMSTARAKALQI